MPVRTSVFACALTIATTLLVAAAASPPELGGSLGGRQVFPVSNWWNQDISAAPIDQNSAAFIAHIGAARTLHPDFGPSPYGIPYVVVAGDQPLVRRSGPRTATRATKGRRAGRSAIRFPTKRRRSRTTSRARYRAAGRAVIGTC